MSYTGIETSIQSGRPVELYDFGNGGAHYRYTSADGDVVYGGNTYTAAPISRSAIEATSETVRTALNVTVARDLGILALFSTMPPENVVSLSVLRLHAGDGEAITQWMGRVLNVTFGNVSAEIHCESVYTSLQRVGLRRPYQVPCPHVVYGNGCNLDRTAFDAAATVSAITGATLTLSGLGSFSDGYFAGGYLEWQKSAGVYERRAVRSQIGGTVIISFPIPGMAAAAAVTLYPGCDHTLATCENKFGNHLNYGGMPCFPTKNPFDGTIIY